MGLNGKENENNLTKQMKKMVKKALIYIGITLAILLLIAGFVWVLISKALDFLAGGVDDLGSSYISTDASSGLEPGINITDEQIDELVEMLEKNGFTVQGLYLCGDIDYTKDADDPENIAQRNKYLRQFLKAELCTLYPDFKIEEDETHFNGIIQIKRASDNSDSTTSRDMEYVRKDVFDAMISSIQNNSVDSSLSGYSIQELQSKIKNVYSIDNSGNLYFATWSTIESNGETQFTVASKSVNYKRTVEKFGMPIEVPLALCFTSQNPEYVYQFIEDHVLNGEIVITIQDTQRVDTYESWYDYSIKTTEDTTIPEYIDENGIVHEEETQNNSYDTEYYNQNALTSVRTTIDGVAQITSVDTWMITETVSYTNTQGKVQYPLGNETVEHEDVEFPGELPEDETDTLTMGTVVATVDKSYSVNWCKLTEKENIVYNEWERNTINVDTADVEKKAKSIVEQWNIPYRIPNTNRKEAAGENIVIGDQILLELLNKETTQKQEEIFRYLLYLYTGNSYGVTSLDFSIFKDIDFITIGSSSGNKLLVEYIHMWENASGPPTNADGTKYIIQDDGFGHPTVGYGLDIFNGGYASLLEQAGYPTNIGGEVDKEFVDALEEQTIQSKIDSIKAATAGLDLKEYQIHALVSRAYNCGFSGAITVTRGSPALNFVDSYKRYWNEETDDQFEEQNNNADFGHSLYTQYMSKPVTSGGQYARGLERRRKSEWTLFQTGYYDVLGQWYKEGGDILSMCEEVMNDLINNNVHYSLTNLVWNNIEASNDFSRHGCCCATYVTVVLYRAGILSEEYINKYNYNYTGGVNSMLRDAGWIHFSEEEAQAGDVCVYNGHTFIYAGGNEIWDQSSGCISSSGTPPVGRNFFTMELL